MLPHCRVLALTAAQGGHAPDVGPAGVTAAQPPFKKPKASGAAVNASLDAAVAELMDLAEAEAPPTVAEQPLVACEMAPAAEARCTDVEELPATQPLSASECGKLSFQPSHAPGAGMVSLKSIHGSRSSSQAQDLPGCSHDEVAAALKAVISLAHPSPSTLDCAETVDEIPLRREAEV